MPRPTPLMAEIGRLIRVDRAAREIVEAIDKETPIEKLWWRDQYGESFFKITHNRLFDLQRALSDIDPRAPNIIYPPKDRWG